MCHDDRVDIDIDMMHDLADAGLAALASVKRVETDGVCLQCWLKKTTPFARSAAAVGCGCGGLRLCYRSTRLCIRCVVRCVMQWANRRRPEFLIERRKRQLPAYREFEIRTVVERQGMAARQRQRPVRLSRTRTLGREDHR